MQLSKPFLVVCAAALAIMPLSLSAADTEAQIRAREALDKKLQEMQAQEPAPPPKASSKKTKKAPAEPAPAAKQTPPPAQPPAQTPPPAPVVEPAPPSPPPPAPVPVVQPPPPTPAPEPVVQTPPPAPETSAQPPVHSKLPRPDSPEVVKAREALRLKMQELDAQQAAAPPAVTQPPPTVVAQPPPEPAPAIAAASAPPEPNPAPVKAEPKKHRAEPKPASPSQTAKYNRPPGFPPMEGPALPISAEKQQRLATINQQYQADQLTPEQYHEARAKIIAEP